jgi:hypothetical protein
MNIVTLVLAPEHIKSILTQLETGIALHLPLVIKSDYLYPTMTVTCYYYHNSGIALLIKLTNDERRRIRRYLLFRYNK